MLTFGDLCCGGGGSSIGAIAAGLTPLWAIESDPCIAAVYRQNVGPHVVIGDVAKIDPASLLPVDFLLASFPCQDSSVARSKKLAPREDGNLALCVLDYARILRPAVIVMENVPPWRRKPVYRQVVSGLSALGYFVDGQLVDMSRHGVPQTRRRCIVRAVWGGLVLALPAPTPRIGWYAAIEDLLPGLPETKFAPWQERRLGGFGDFDRQRSFLLDDQRSGKGGYTGVERGATCALADDPCFTVTAGSGKQRPLRAFLAHPSADNDRFTVRRDAEPAHTISGTHGCTRSWLGRGRVVALTPRCLARLQTFPDWYELPAQRALAGRIIGNAAPPVFVRRILEGLLPSVRQQQCAASPARTDGAAAEGRKL